MLSKADIDGWNAIDEEAVRAGGYLATPKRPLIIEYDYRAMSRYCTQKGINPMDMTEDELKKFEYAEPLVYA